LRHPNPAWGGEAYLVCKNGDLFQAKLAFSDEAPPATLGYAGTLTASQMNALKKVLGKKSFSGTYHHSPPNMADANVELSADYHADGPLTRSLFQSFSQENSTRESQKAK
jgi:hypothetical protein